jgi:hypothetical protein
MAKSNSIDYRGSYNDDDSGVGLDLDYSSATSTMIESTPSYGSQSRILSPPQPTQFMKQRHDIAPLVRVSSDGIIQRIRPITMRNSENGDFVLCQTDRGAYVAYRTPIVPEWVTRLVEEIESRQQ